MLFEGRDTAGKGGTIKRITEKTNPRVRAAPSRSARRPSASARSGTSSATSPTCPPPARSSCSTAVGTTAPASSTSWASAPQDEYEEFMRTCPQFERDLLRSGIILIKYWLSVSDEEQERRFKARLQRPGQAVEAQRRWTSRPAARWVDYAEAKDEMFAYTDTKRVAVVRRRGRRQADDAAEPHQPPAEPDPLRGRRRTRRSSCRRGRSGPTSARRSATRTTCPCATWSVRRSRPHRRHRQSERTISAVRSRPQ